MSRTVYLHVGAPKTGTTYLQDRLSVNSTTLAAQGVHFPTISPLVSPGLAHFRASLDLLGQDQAQRDFTAVGVRIAPGTPLPAPAGVFPRHLLE